MSIPFLFQELSYQHRSGHLTCEFSPISTPVKFEISLPGCGSGGASRESGAVVRRAVGIEEVAGCNLRFKRRGAARESGAVVSRAVVEEVKRATVVGGRSIAMLRL